MKTIKKNEALATLIVSLKTLAIEQKVNLWKRIASDLEKPSRQRRIVNIYKLNQHSTDGETIIVPGKVLGVGELDHKVNVAALSFSTEAEEKIAKNGACMSIEELMKKDPKGSKVRILG